MKRIKIKIRFEKIRSKLLLCFMIFSILMCAILNILTVTGAVFFYVEDNFECNITPGTPINSPVGTPRGFKPGMVAWSWDPTVTSWDGTSSSYWWDSSNLDQTKVDIMFDSGIKQISGDLDLEVGWRNLFTYINNKVYDVDKGYTKGEKIAIKVNLNNDYRSYKFEKPGSSQVSPQLLKTLIRNLVSYAKVEQKDISLYDASRLFGRQFHDPPEGLGGDYPNLNFVDNDGGVEYATKVVRDLNSSLTFSNHALIGWDNTQLPIVATKARYMIVVNAFRSHVLAGITLSGKNFYGSIYQNSVNCEAFFENGHWCPWNLHGVVYRYHQMGSYSPLVDLLGHPDLGGKAVLYIHDALYSGYTQESRPPIKYKMYPFNNEYMSSIFVSQDPIAIDSVGFDFMRNEPELPHAREGCIANYLKEGALANAPPSGIEYKPGGKLLNSLGVYEHWDNDIKMEYTGNGTGIELVKTFVIPKERKNRIQFPLKPFIKYKIYYFIFAGVFLIMNFSCIPCIFNMCLRILRILKQKKLEKGKNDPINKQLMTNDVIMNGGNEFVLGNEEDEIKESDLKKLFNGLDINNYGKLVEFEKGIVSKDVIQFNKNFDSKLLKLGINLKKVNDETQILIDEEHVKLEKERTELLIKQSEMEAKKMKEEIFGGGGCSKK